MPGWRVLCHVCAPSLLQIVDAVPVHENGSFIYLQPWALGRAALPDVLEKEGHPLVAPGPIPIPLRTKDDDDTPPPLPRALTVDEIEEYVQLYATAAEDAVLRARFDGYLPDQFLQTNVNDRTDGYGSSVQNRVWFVLEVIDAVVKAVGTHRAGIRFGPPSTVCEISGETGHTSPTTTLTATARWRRSSRRVAVA